MDKKIYRKIYALLLGQLNVLYQKCNFKTHTSNAYYLLCFLYKNPWGRFIGISLALLIFIKTYFLHYLSAAFLSILALLIFKSLKLIYTSLWKDKPPDISRKDFTFFKQIYFQTWWILCFETLLHHFWKITCWTLLFLGLWLFQISSIISLESEIILYFIFIIGIAIFFITDLLSFRFPLEKDVYRSLEKENDLQHRPLSSAKDQLINPHAPYTQELWTTNKKRWITYISSLRPPKFKSLLSQQDPYALRGFIALFFIIGFATAGPYWKQYIYYGLTPLDRIEPSLQKNISLWITPPSYTGLEQISLELPNPKNKKNAQDDIIFIPESSTVKLRYTSSSHSFLNIQNLFPDMKFLRPHLQTGTQKFALEKLGNQSYGLDVNIGNASDDILKEEKSKEGKKKEPAEKNTKTQKIYNLSLSGFLYKKHISRYALIKDMPPLVEVTKQPQALHNAHIQLGLSVFDDYGVKDISLQLQLDDILEDGAPLPLGNNTTITRSVMSPGGQNFAFEPLYDFSSHGWAGLPVVVKLTISDHKEQTAQTEKLRLTLPERNFEHPVAKKIIALRKKLLWDKEQAIKKVSKELESLLLIPSSYQDDIVVFLALRSASSRLREVNTRKSLSSVIPLLWDTALRVEDGNLSLAARNLKDAQNKLEQALRQPHVSEEEIAQLMHQLKQAMREYLQEVQKQLQKELTQSPNMPLLPPEMMPQIIDPQALSSFLEQMESEMKYGDKNTAQQMLSQLQRLMDMLNPSLSMGRQAMPQDMQMMMKGINEIQELIEKQQDLLERTKIQTNIQNLLKNYQQDFGKIVQGQEKTLKEWKLEDLPMPHNNAKTNPGSAPQKNITKEKPRNNFAPINTQAKKAEQEALRIILGQLMKEAGIVLEEIPKNLGLAEQEMRLSSKALSKNNPQGSTPHQEQAIQYLKEALEDLSQQMMARMQAMPGFGYNGAQFDPLGRPYGQQDNNNGLFPNSRVEIPDEAQQRRVDDILKLLRRRSGELNRPEIELEYYRRLLRQF